MSEVPAVSGINSRPGLNDDTLGTGGDALATRVAAVFAEDGPLAQTVPDFEPRPGQVENCLLELAERLGVFGASDMARIKQP